LIISALDTTNQLNKMKLAARLKLKLFKKNQKELVELARVRLLIILKKSVNQIRKSIIFVRIQNSLNTNKNTFLAMKLKLVTLLTFLSLFLVSSFSYAQDRDFDGLWSGKITKDDGTTFSLTLYIDGNTVFATYEDSDGDLAKDLSKDVIWSAGYGQQLNFVWINTGGAWTETQMFSICWISSSKLSVYYTRHVSNESDTFDGNTDWGYTGTGFLFQD